MHQFGLGSFFQWASFTQMVLRNYVTPTVANLGEHWPIIGA